MAMGGGAKSDEPITAINVTPMIDVCLVLVIIFMALAPMAMTVGIKVLESRSKAAEGKASAEENVNVKLTSAGKIFVNNAEVAPDDLGSAIVTALSKSKDKMVIITADDDNHVGQVVAILDTARQSGAVKLAILKNEAQTPAAQGGKT